jgi:hypothetical protein
MLKIQNSCFEIVFEIVVFVFEIVSFENLLFSQNWVKESEYSFPRENQG